METPHATKYTATAATKRVIRDMLFLSKHQPKKGGMSSDPPTLDFTEAARELHFTNVIVSSMIFAFSLSASEKWSEVVSEMEDHLLPDGDMSFGTRVVRAVVHSAFFGALAYVAVRCSYSVTRLRKKLRNIRNARAAGTT